MVSSGRLFEHKMRTTSIQVHASALGSLLASFAAALEEASTTAKMQPVIIARITELVLWSVGTSSFQIAA